MISIRFRGVAGRLTSVSNFSSSLLLNRKSLRIFDLTLMVATLYLRVFSEGNDATTLGEIILSQESERLHLDGLLRSTLQMDDVSESCRTKYASPADTPKSHFTITYQKFVQQKTTKKSSLMKKLNK